MKKSKLVFLPSLTLSETHLEPERTLLIFDRHLEKVSKEFRTWVRGFPHRYGVFSGEKLKDLRAFPLHYEKLSKIASELTPKNMCVAGVGGGSVGDFAGFFASVYKRGVELIHVPSTWLAAIDSSHGGKTALNNGRVKNQLGTFHPASRVILIRSLLAAQPHDRVADANGELAKIAMIDGGAWVAQMEKSDLEGGNLIWKFLKPAIQSKLRIVEKDPLEQTGTRQILNLGHTVGHIFEAHYGWTHGRAITQGLFFAIEFALHTGEMAPREARRALQLLTEVLELAREIPAKKISSAEFMRYLGQDKKKSARGEVVFLVPHRFGRVRREKVNLSHLLAEARRQDWVQR